jgi:hypothetical protein
MRPAPEIITYLATAACFGFGFYAVAWLIFAAFKYADAPDDRTDQRPNGDRPFVPPGLAGNNLLHDRSNER